MKNTNIPPVPKNPHVAEMPRVKSDFRVRFWSQEEKDLVIEAYQAGKSRNAIRKLVGCSFSPITRLLAEEGVLKPQHQYWVKKK